MTEEKSIVDIPLQDLLRVTPFKGCNDVRPYLNGVLVTPYEDHALLVATNGHWMAVYESAQAHTDQDRILELPDWFVRQCESLDKDGRLDGADDDDEGWRPENSERSYRSPQPERAVRVVDETSRLIVLEAYQDVLVKPGLPFIDGKFPQWKKVLPDPAELEKGLFEPFAPSYLSCLRWAVPHDHEHPLFCYQSRTNHGKSCAVFRFGGLPNFILALMPRRDSDKEPGTWPAWMRKEQEAAA